LNSLTGNDITSSWLVGGCRCRHSGRECVADLGVAINFFFEWIANHAKFTSKLSTLGLAPPCLCVEIVSGLSVFSLNVSYVIDLPPYHFFAESVLRRRLRRVLLGFRLVPILFFFV
jgi:hypothetical protein